LNPRSVSLDDRKSITHFMIVFTSERLRVVSTRLSAVWDAAHSTLTFRNST